MVADVDPQDPKLVAMAGIIIPTGISMGVPMMHKNPVDVEMI